MSAEELQFVVYKMTYILWVATLLGAFDVIQMAAILDAILDFTENKKLSKTVKNWNFLILDLKNMT